MPFARPGRRKKKKIREEEAIGETERNDLVFVGHEEDVRQDVVLCILIE